MTVAYDTKPFIERPYDWSFSRIQRFHDCPRAWLAIYIEQREEHPSPMADQGRIFHEIAAAYVKHLVGAGMTEDAIALDAIASAHTVDPAILDMVRRGLGGRTFDTEKLVGVERNYFGTLPNGQVLMGRIDRLEWDTEGVCHIVDYKTGSAEPPGRDQGMIYAWLVHQTYPTILKFRLVHEFPRIGKRAMLRYPTDGTMDWHEVAGVGEYVYRVVKQIEEARKADNWPATPGKFCRYCPAWEDCPAVANEPNKATEIAGHILWLERALAERRDQLTIYLQRDGREINVNGEAFRLAEGSPRKSWDAKAFRQIAKRLGLRDDDYLAVDGRKASKFLDAHPELEDALTVKPGTVTLKHGKSAEEENGEDGAI